MFTIPVRYAYFVICGVFWGESSLCEQESETWDDVIGVLDMTVVFLVQIQICIIPTHKQALAVLQCMIQYSSENSDITTHLRYDEWN